MTTNRPITSLGEVLGDTTAAAALLDRLLHRSVVLDISGVTPTGYATTTPAPTTYKRRPTMAETPQDDDSATTAPPTTSG